MLINLRFSKDYLITFALLLVPGLTPGIKRESGVNPGLSRSCKLH